MNASPTSLGFEQVRVGMAAADRSITLTNTGGVPVQVTGCPVSPASDFVVSCPEPPDDTMAPGGTRAAVVRFSPRSRGSRAATLTVHYRVLSAPPVDESVTVSLLGLGSGPQMLVTVMPASPEPLDFGSAQVGIASVDRFTISVRNTGEDPLSASLSLSGSDTADWAFAPPATPFAVAANGERLIVATFTPRAVGERSATLTITDNGGLSTPPSVSLDLIGTGEPPSPAILISPTALAFGAMDVQLNQPTLRAITVANPGGLALEVAMSLEMLDGSPYEGNEFEILTGEQMTVPAGGQGRIDVQYRPALESDGDFAKLVLETNAPGAGQVEITMSGRGVDRHIQVSPLSIDFEPTYRNPATPPEVEVQVENTGESPLVLGDLMTEGEAADSFVVVGELDEVIAPQDSSSLIVEFRPRAAPEEPLQAVLLIINDDDDRPLVRIDLSGIGILPPIVSTYAAIEWGSVAVGVERGPPTGAPLTLRNESSADTFVVQDVRVVDDQGGSLDAVRIAGLADPRELGPGEELVLDVVFAPTRGGAMSGTIEVLIGADPEPVLRVPVAGVAVEAEARGGAGCSAGAARASSTGALAGAWVLALAFASGFASRSRRGRRRSAAAGAFLAAALAGPADPTAVAQMESGEDLDLTTFRPLHAVHPMTVTVETTDVGEAGSSALSLSFDHARNPLVLHAADGDMVDRPVSARSTLELAGAFAFSGRFEAAAVVPFLSQSGDAPRFSGVEPAEGTALGDIRLHGRVFIGSSGRLRFGAAAELTLPTALDTPFAGAAGPSAMMRGLADYRLGRLLVALNAGAVFRERVRLADVELGSQALYGAAAALELSPRLHGIAELYGSLGPTGGSPGTRPLEGILATRVRVSREVGLLAGAGRGLLAGVGAPELRLFIALGWSPHARPTTRPNQEVTSPTDDDHDGVVNQDDRCPDEVEDLDGFQDEDGCLDADDDGDRVPDTIDRCPRQAEDADQFEDEDGCPEPDNDGDGVDDQADRCPLEAEDADRFEDEDGCPEPDNDGDGIDDSADRCPLEKETINGNRDDDGCPDAGSGLVLVTADRIEVLEPIRFRRGGSVLTGQSQQLLGQLAATLRAHREIVRVRIRVHVQPRGAGDEALSVARAEVVRRWLIESGIEATRLEGVGHGSRQQLFSGRGARVRAMNDRVEFEIVERRR